MRRPRVDYDNIDLNITLDETDYGWKFSYQNFDNCLTKVSVKTKEEVDRLIKKLIKERQNFHILTKDGYINPFFKKPNLVISLGK